MQNKSTAFRSLVLLSVLIATGIFMRGLVDAFPPYFVSLENTGGQASYLLGEPIRFTGVLEVEASDINSTAVNLVVNGPQGFTQAITDLTVGTKTFASK